MKKVLSVLLAAAMVMGMSVASFADKNWAANSNDCMNGAVRVDSLSWHGIMRVDHTDGTTEYVEAGTNYKNMKVGDDLYFYVLIGNEAFYTGQIDEHWSINIKGNEYVENVKFVRDSAAEQNRVMVKVEIVDTLDNLDDKDVKFQMYIADNKHGTKQSETAKLNYSFDNYKECYVEFDETNDVDYMAKWIVRDEEKGTAIFDFEDEAYFTVKMIPEEKVIFNFSQAYDKKIDKAYNEYDADLSFYNFKGTKDAFTKTGELFIPADDETFIYEIVDGKLVEVEAEYVEDYKVDGFSEKDGWVIETKELGYYVVADEELVVAEEEVEAEPEVEADKANPETGAADFVGAAVAMAVVSVAAAGALALKK